MGNQTAATILGKIIAKLRLSQSFLWRLEARIKGVEFEGQVQFQGRPIISLVKASRIVMGHGVSVASARRANPLGLFQPCVLRAMAPGAQLILGPGVGLSGTVVWRKRAPWSGTATADINGMQLSSVSVDETLSGWMLRNSRRGHVLCVPV